MNEIKDFIKKQNTFTDCSIFLWATVGSRAYGIATEESDTDFAGILIRPTRQVLSMFSHEDSTSIHAEYDCQLWEVKKFLHLLCQSNPNALEILYSPLWIESSAWAEELRANGYRFLSKASYPKLRGFIRSQLKGLEGSRVEGDTHNYDRKAATHALRLAYVATELYSTGIFHCKLPEKAANAIVVARDGNYSLDAILDRIDKAFVKMDEAFVSCTLPDNSDVEWASEFLYRIRKEYLI